MGAVYKPIAHSESGLSVREELGLSPDDAITSETFLDLIIAGGLTKRMNRVWGTLIVEEGLWNAAMELARSDDPRVAFRSSWALEWAYNLESAQIWERFPLFFDTLLSSGSESVQRVYSKMLCDMLRSGTVVLNDSEAMAAAERCFGLLTDSGTPVSVKVWQIELLYDLTPRLDWIEENLTAVVRLMSESSECTPAMAAHARHYFRRMQMRT